MFLNFGTQCQFLLKFLLIWISLQHLCLLSWGGLAIWVIGHLHFCPALDTNRAAAVEMTGHLFLDDQTTEPSSSSLHFFIGISHLFFFPLFNSFRFEASKTIFNCSWNDRLSKLWSWTTNQTSADCTICWWCIVISGLNLFICSSGFFYGFCGCVSKYSHYV